MTDRPFSLCRLSLSSLVLSYIAIFALFLVLEPTVASTATTCGVGKKTTASGECKDLDNKDVFQALHGLAHPPKWTEEHGPSCKKLTVVQGIAVCEDYLPEDCVMWSVVATSYCGHFGSLEFEKYWSARCKVRIFHYTLYIKGNTCSQDDAVKEYPNIEMTTHDIWAAKTFASFYKLVTLPLAKNVDVLKIQRRAGVNEDFDGIQFTLLADLYLHKRELYKHVKQIVYSASINSETLVDSVGREAEHAWNMWATNQFLSRYVSIHTDEDTGRLQPLQFDYLLSQAKLSTEYSYYHHTFVRLEDEEAVRKNIQAMEAFEPNYLPRLRADVPKYCRPPQGSEDEEMQRWINVEVQARCHATRLWVACDRNRPYDGFIPCQKELMDDLAEDYAASKGWCTYRDSTSDIQELTKVDPEATKAFQRKDKPSCGVRLAFFFTVYADSAFVTRLFDRVYSEDHYYLFHVDPTGASVEFERDLRALASKHKNVFIAKDVPIVYGASTATILLTRAMAWFLRHASGWDYFVPLTGSDYPLVPLKRIEKIFAKQSPPMPFVMAWTPGTSTHLFRLSKTHPVFEVDPLLVLSMDAVTFERGKVLGAVPMEYRSMNFGPPLFCNGKKSFYHLDNRRNKSGESLDTQWLFPRDKYPGRGRAYADEVPELSILPVDNVFRVWKKSDPATTGAYDLETIRYIIDSEEGKKYYHFFKHMLLGSEEHYYVSLLYNWERTRMAVQSLSAQIVWNTWELGLWESSGGFQTHTHFLTMAEWDILKGFAKRGMMFARKFSTKKTLEVIDKIDEYVHFNKSTDAGVYWPGYFHTDVTTPGKSWVANFRKNATTAAKFQWTKFYHDSLKYAWTYSTNGEPMPDYITNYPEFTNGVTQIVTKITPTNKLHKGGSASTIIANKPVSKPTPSVAASTTTTSSGSSSSTRTTSRTSSTAHTNTVGSHAQTSRQGIVGRGKNYLTATIN